MKRLLPILTIVASLLLLAVPAFAACDEPATGAGDKLSASRTNSQE